LGGLWVSCLLLETPSRDGFIWISSVRVVVMLMRSVVWRSCWK
jgi:hypothetical protein